MRPRHVPVVLVVAFLVVLRSCEGARLRRRVTADPVGPTSVTGPVDVQKQEAPVLSAAKGLPAVLKDLQAAEVDLGLAKQSGLSPTSKAYRDKEEKVQGLVSQRAAVNLQIKTFKKKMEEEKKTYVADLEDPSKKAKAEKSLKELEQLNQDIDQAAPPMGDERTRRLAATDAAREAKLAKAAYKEALKASGGKETPAVQQKQEKAFAAELNAVDKSRVDMVSYAPFPGIDTAQAGKMVVPEDADPVPVPKSKQIPLDTSKPENSPQPVSTHAPATTTTRAPMPGEPVTAAPAPPLPAGLSTAMPSVQVLDEDPPTAVQAARAAEQKAKEKVNDAQELNTLQADMKKAEEVVKKASPAVKKTVTAKPTTAALLVAAEETTTTAVPTTTTAPVRSTARPTTAAPGAPTTAPERTTTAAATTPAPNPDGSPGTTAAPVATTTPAPNPDGTPGTTAAPVATTTTAAAATPTTTRAAAVDDPVVPTRAPTTTSAAETTARPTTAAPVDATETAPTSTTAPSTAAPEAATTEAPQEQPEARDATGVSKPKKTQPTTKAPRKKATTKAPATTVAPAVKTDEDETEPTTARPGEPKPAKKAPKARTTTARPTKTVLRTTAKPLKTRTTTTAAPKPPPSVLPDGTIVKHDGASHKLGPDDQSNCPRVVLKGKAGRIRRAWAAKMVRKIRADDRVLMAGELPQLKLVKQCAHECAVFCSPCSTAVDILTLLEEQAGTSASPRLPADRRLEAERRISSTANANQLLMCEKECMATCNAKGAPHPTPDQAVAEMTEMVLEREGSMGAKATAQLQADLRAGLKVRATEEDKAKESVTNDVRAAEDALSRRDQAVVQREQATLSTSVKNAQEEEATFDKEKQAIKAGIDRALRQATAGSVARGPGQVPRVHSPVFDINSVVAGAKKAVAAAATGGAGQSPTVPTVPTASTQPPPCDGGPCQQDAKTSLLIQVAQHTGGVPVLSSEALKGAVMAAVAKEHESSHGTSASGGLRAGQHAAPSAAVSSGSGAKTHGLRHIVAPAYANQNSGHASRKEPNADSDEDGDDEDSEEDSDDSSDDENDHSDVRFKATHRHHLDARGGATHMTSGGSKAGAGSPWWLNPPPWWLPPPPEWGSPPPSVYSPFYSPYSIPQPFHASPAHNSYPAYTPTPLPY